MNTSSVSNTQTQYNNLIVRGTGFLNRPRVVEGKKCPKYFAASIAANRCDDNEKSLFEVRIVGSEAKSLFEKLLQEFPALLDKDWKKRPTVSCGFSIGDIQAKTYTSKDDKEVPYIDGRLLKFTFITVSGEKWYSAKDPASDAPADETQPDAELAA